MATALVSPPYNPPSRYELAQDIRQNAPAMHIYHACPEWLPIEVFGRTFWVPPHIEGEPTVEHPTRRARTAEGLDAGPEKHRANGRLAIKDIWGIIREKRSNRPIGLDVLEGQTAGAIVVFMVENYGERGVVWLRGDDTDKGRMETSRKLYSRFIRTWAEGERSARAEFVRRWNDNKDNAGRVPPPPTPNQLRAQELIDQLATETRSGAEHICIVCYGWEGSSFEKYARHMKAAHGRIVQPPKDDTTNERAAGQRLSASEVGTLTAPPAGEGLPVGEGAAGPGVALGAAAGIDFESPAVQGRSRKPTKK